jgi:UDP-N-acetyl-D-galactosamine dehydrogenase
LGITFKENCPDIRNTKVVDIFSTLAEYTNNITIYDPWASEAEVQHEYQLNITNTLPQENKYDAIILAVSHNEFLNIDIKALLNDNGVVYDVKGVLDRNIIDGRL